MEREGEGEREGERERESKQEATIYAATATAARSFLAAGKELLLSNPSLHPRKSTPPFADAPAWHLESTNFRRSCGLSAAEYPWLILEMHIAYIHTHTKRSVFVCLFVWHS